ncbi:MAG: hypothetical protein ACRERU_01315 [Methylococcales bacterium]
MTDYRLTGRFYLLPTPKGAFQALTHPYRSLAQHFVINLLRTRSSPLSEPETITALLEGCDSKAAMKTMHEAQSAGWIQGFAEVQQLPDRPVSQALHDLLSTLSSSGHALLADHGGFPVASAGFSANHSQRLAILAAELAVIHNRHADYLAHSLAIDEPGWGLIDPLGASKIGIWVLYPGKHRFILLINDMPNLNRRAFVTLSWILVHRYG